MQVNGYSLPANEVSNRFPTRSGKGVGGAIKQNPPTRIRLNGNIVRRMHDTLPISQARPLIVSLDGNKATFDVAEHLSNEKAVMNGRDLSPFERLENRHYSRSASLAGWERLSSISASKITFGSLRTPHSEC